MIHEKTSDNYIIIFVKNPEKGKVKTRLAKTMGDDRALEIYLMLLDYTREIVQPLEADKGVFYSSFIDRKDLWQDGFQKRIQVTGNLGAKMHEAFSEIFAEGYQKVIILGSDCYELNTGLIEEAFQSLDDNDVVIGPARDGGYYLLGMRNFLPQLFANKSWSTEVLLDETKAELESGNLSYRLLPTLSDVDHEEDLAGWDRIQAKS